MGDMDLFYRHVNSFLIRIVCAEFGSTWKLFQRRDFLDDKINSASGNFQPQFMYTKQYQPFHVISDLLS
jgi:hypothetical protein